MRNDASALACAAAMLGGEGLIQRYQREIETISETSIFLIDDDYSPALLKRPKSGHFRVQSDHGGSVERIFPSAAVIAAARRIAADCPGELLYARVDAIVRGGELLLKEVERVEPELFFAYCPEAAAHLANALIDKLS